MHVRSLLRSGRPVPSAYRSNFKHLYLDIAWYGVLAASALSFVAVYAARVGASAFQIGLLSAGPAVVNLIFTLPTGRWLEKQSMGRAVFWAAAFHRFFYLLWIPLPLLLGPQGQVWALVILTLLMSIPGTALAVGFNALFADAVPPEWRGHVVGTRNALLSVTFIAVSLLCGQILEHVPFPTGYQVVFAIGFLGAAMSTIHVGFVVPCPTGQPQPRVGRGLGDLARPGRVRAFVDGLRGSVGLRFLLRRRGLGFLRTEILRGPYGRLILVLFAFYFTIHLAVPLFPIQWVDQIHLSDREIALGTAAFYVSVFVGSTQLDRLTRRLGNHRMTAIGALFMSSYPAFMALADGLGLFLVGSAMGGLGWSLVGGSLTNYILERIPGNDRPAHLAWYNLALNAALLVGSLSGPVIAGAIGIPVALLVFAALRGLASLAILRWG
jgi:MFS family permease